VTNLFEKVELIHICSEEAREDQEEQGEASHPVGSF
jgi:hypothetical protein